MSVLTQNVNSCQRTGAYTKGKNGETAESFMVRTYYKISEYSVSSRPIDVVNQRYRDGVENCDVVAIKFFINVYYKERNFVVHSQVCFPPNFPFVPPIFSVRNTDLNKFQTNQLFCSNPLPDGSFEVKLNQASAWSFNLSPDLLFREFATTLTQNFPFHRTDSPSHPPFPSIYDPRYNNPNMQFPFISNPSAPEMPQKNVNWNTNYNTSYDSGQKGTPYQGYGYQTNQGFTQDSGNLYGGNYNGPSRPQGPYGHNPYNPITEMQTGKQPSGNTFRNIPVLKNAVAKLQKEIEEDLRDEEASQEYLTTLKKKLKDFEIQITERVGKIEEKTVKLDKETEKLQKIFEEYNKKELDLEMLGKIIKFDNPEDELELQNKSMVLGLNDTCAFIEDAFLDKDVATYEQTVKTLEKVWKKTFDTILSQKAVDLARSAI